MIATQAGDDNVAGKMGFQDMFGAMIADVGSSLRSGKIATEVHEENLMAAAIKFSSCTSVAILPERRDDPTSAIIAPNISWNPIFPATLSSPACVAIIRSRLRLSAVPDASC